MNQRIDVSSIARKVSRELFMGVDTRTRTKPLRKYKRKEKHKNQVDY